MATNYNITMRQFNGTDYDTLYPAANLSNSIGKIQASQVEGLSITPDMGDATGTLAVSHGGTGRTSLTSGYYLVGNGTGAVILQSPSQLQSSLGLDQYAKIQTGSYTGTGTYGSSNPNSLTFNFAPNALFLQKEEINIHQAGNFWDWFPRNTFLIKTTTNRIAVTSYAYNTTSSTFPISSTSVDIVTDFNNTNLSWYQMNNVGWQFNDDGVIIYYVAF